MMEFIITGGKPLYGSIRLGGAKNSSFKLMIASLLCQGESRLLNLPHISDVEVTKAIITDLGGSVRSAGERTFFIDTKKFISQKVSSKYGSISRASAMFLPVLLARFGRAEVPLPGGDKIGSRPLNWHLTGLEQMGAVITQQKGMMVAEAKVLKGISYRFPKNTHTGTETLILAAVLARGKTVLENAALEPEVDDLMDYLNKMGAKIRRREGRVIEVFGVKRLTPAIHQIMPDRNEAVSYACAAIATKGDIIVENARKDDIETFLEKLEEAGGGYEVGNYGVRFYYRGKLKATDVITRPHPGFMSDWQPLWAVMLTQATGTSVIHEAVHSYRFHYVSDLVRMGAKIKTYQPAVGDEKRFYNFDFQPGEAEASHAIKISGPTDLVGGEFKVHDLRAGATLVLAGLVAKGTSRLMAMEQIDRGYEDLDGRLRSMGAEIRRKTSR